jgi:hypothetical protein
MRVGDEEMTDVASVDTCQPQLGQYAIAAASVNQKPGAVEALQHKTRIEAAGNERTARPQHGNGWFTHSLSLVFTHSLSPVISHDE